MSEDSPSAWVVVVTMGDPVSVPLCDEHHRRLHEHGNEERWWALEGIEPLEWAEIKWKEFLDR